MRSCLSLKGCGILALTLGLSAAVTLCPVSETEQLPWLGFPLDVYGGTNADIIPSSQRYKCWAYESKEREPHTEYKTYEERMVDFECPAAAAAKCPVTSKHRADFRQTASWSPPLNSSFCAWVRHSLQPSCPGSSSGSPRVVNVVVLGGSVAMGFGTRGCCCTECGAPLNASCARDYSYSRAIMCPRITCPSSDYFLPSSYACPWSGRLVRWLNKQYGATGRVRFKLKNLGEGSANSHLTSRVLNKQLRFFNTTLSADDLVILDHSFNDAGYTPKVGEGSTFGLELLIRRVIMHSTTGMLSPPVILLLESNPFLNPEANRKNYVDLAKHYTLIHWNFRPVVDGLAAPGSPDAAPFDDHLRLKHLQYTDQHPSWHWHLFLAELMAGNFASAVEACGPSTCTAGTDGNRPKFPTPLPFNALPRDAMCAKVTAATPNIVDVDARDEFLATATAGVQHKKERVHQERLVGTVSVRNGASNSKGWSLVEDRPNKFGWVIESLNITTTSNGGNSTLVFTPTSSAAAALAALPTGSRVILRVSYLATYANAGLADVSFCGTRVTGGFGLNQGTIDALWPAFETYHVSSPELWEQELKWFGAAQNGGGWDDKAVGPVGAFGGWSREEDDWKPHHCIGPPELEIAYRARSRSELMRAGEGAASWAARRFQKVRILSAQVCISQQQT